MVKFTKLLFLIIATIQSHKILFYNIFFELIDYICNRIKFNALCQKKKIKIAL